MALPPHGKRNKNEKRKYEHSPPRNASKHPLYPDAYLSFDWQAALCAHELKESNDQKNEPDTSEQRDGT